jgi:quercetin dioxygenase-like cupin family protein
MGRKDIPLDQTCQRASCHTVTQRGAGDRQPPLTKEFWTPLGEKSGLARHGNCLTMLRDRTDIVASTASSIARNSHDRFARETSMADTTRSDATIPPDDPNNKLTLANPDDPTMRHVSVAGGTYTILVTGAQTNGRYCLIDMLVPSGGGPPPHRHDFEEMFTILEGEIELTFRGEVKRAAAGSTVNIPANAPHFFRNVSDRPARLLCMCTPAGQEEFFMSVGDPVEGRTAPPPALSKDEQAERVRRAKALAAKYRTELLV